MSTVMTPVVESRLKVTFPLSVCPAMVRLMGVPETVNPVVVRAMATLPEKLAIAAIGPPELMVPLAVPVTEVLPARVAMARSAAPPVTESRPPPMFRLRLAR